MKIFSALLTSSVALSILAGSVSASSGTKTYSKSGVSFSYPTGWSVLPDSTTKTFGNELAGFGKGVITFGAAGGVSKLWNHRKNGVIAILAKMDVTKKYQKTLKGNEKLFIDKFEAGIKGSSGVKVTGSGTGSFAGQSKATEIQADAKDGKTKLAEQYWIAISSDDKNIDLAIFVLNPVSAWKQYAKTLAAVAASSRFK